MLRAVRRRSVIGGLLPALVIMLVAACGGDDAPGGATCGKAPLCAPGVDASSESVGRPTAIAGVVQKGPFIRGTAVTVQELNDALQPTGRTFETATADDLGGFNVPVNLTSHYVEVIATGYYYDELRDRLSPGPLTLRALSDVGSDGKVDLNMLTSIAAPLVRDLVGRGRTFSAAMAESQMAVLESLGFARQSSAPFDELDIASPGDDNAILLAASLMLEKYAQSFGDSDVAELSQLLSQIGAALSSGGTSSMALAKVRTARCATAGAIDGATVRANLTAHYAALGVTVDIPRFESFIGTSAGCLEAGAGDARADMGDGGSLPDGGADRTGDPTMDASIDRIFPIPDSAGGSVRTCAFPYWEARCTEYKPGRRVSRDGHNWICAAPECRNCASYPGCAPNETGCQFGVVWTHDGACDEGPLTHPVCAGGACKIAFVSSALFYGNAGSTAAVDDLCQREADANRWSGTYKAWVSDSKSSPASRFARATVPYRLVDGSTIADGWNDLTKGSLRHQFNLYSDSVPVPYAYIFTGTTAAGETATVDAGTANCNDWTINRDPTTVVIGRFADVDGGWTSWNLDYCNASSNAYCFEQ